MRTSARAILAAAIVLLLQACTGPVRLSAASDIHAFLISIRDDDRATFFAHVDRPALKAQLSAKLIVDAQRHSDTAAAIAAIAGPPLVGLAVDELVKPQVFRAVAERLGYSPDKPIPDPVQIAQALRPIDDSHVCVAEARDKPCLLTFTNEGGVWRLTAFNGDVSLLRRLARR
jgi:hypothetical protein